MFCTSVRCSMTSETFTPRRCNERMDASQQLWEAARVSHQPIMPLFCSPGDRKVTP